MPPKALISNILAGGLIGIINCTVAISIAALMFAGTKPEYFTAGISVLLIGTLITGLGGTMGSGFNGMIVAPRSGVAPLFASLAAAVNASMMAKGQHADVLPTIIMTIMVTTVFVGAVLFLLGQLKLGGLIRYLPYPVMAGFFAGIGYIFVKGGVSVASGQSLALDNLHAFTSLDGAAVTLPAVLFAVCLFWLQRRSGHWTVFPTLLLVGMAAFYSIVGLSGQTTTDLAEAGWLPKIEAASAGFPLVDWAQLGAVDWTVIGAEAGTIATVAILCSIIALLDISGIEILIARELSPDRELKVAGITNIFSGVAGGYPGVQVTSDTAFTYKLGGDHRLMGLVYAGVIALAIAAGTGFIAAIPTFILGGLLIYLGIDFLADWAWRTQKDFPLSDYFVVLVILGVIAAFGILEGVAFGFAIAIVLFVISYSRLNIVKTEVSGSEHASNVDRDLYTRELLNREGRHIWIMRFQGFIFFGTADRLVATIKQRLSERDAESRVRYLVLDFHHVSQLDTSALQSFEKLAQLADNEQVHVVITGITATVRARLEETSFFASSNTPAQRLVFSQLDEGVEWCEEQTLKGLDRNKGAVDGSLQSLLTKALGSEEFANDIASYFDPVEFFNGDYLFQQGASGDSLYLLSTAVAAVVIDSSVGRERVVRIYNTGAIVGEMALYTGAPRSASVRIEKGGLLFKLDASSLEAMHKKHPAAAGQFHSFIVRLLAERLDRANRELERYA